MEWVPDSRARNAAFREVLSRGDRRELIVLLHTIWAQIEEGGRKPTGSDENAIKRAKKLLYEEFSITTDLASEEAIEPLLRGEITVGDKA